MSLALVKELRERTGAGMLDCKKAIEEAAGDIEKAVDVLRQKGIAKAQKKQSRIAAEGITAIFTNDDKGIVIEVNSETDFVSKNEKFQAFVNNIGNTILNSDAETLEEALKLEFEGTTLSDYVAQMTATIGEKLDLRRFEVLKKNEGEIFGQYVHGGGKISVLLTLKGDKKDVAEAIAMQIAAMNPKYLSIEDVPGEVVEKESAVIKEAMINENPDDSEVVREKRFVGRLNKFYSEICLLEQEFIDIAKLKVKDHLKNNSCEVIKFVRYEVGEGMEKRCDNFAEEVMSQING